MHGLCVVVVEATEEDGTHSAQMHSQHKGRQLPEYSAQALHLHCVQLAAVLWYQMLAHQIKELLLVEQSFVGQIELGLLGEDLKGVCSRGG